MTAIPDPSVDPAMAARLLGRELVTVDDASLREAVGGRRVLITGGGGSIGAELARLLAGLDVAGLTLLDHSERALFWVGESLRESAPDVPVRRVLGTVTDRDGVDRLLAESRPELVLHAAAYKHVALVEENPVAGAEANVLGTDTLMRASLEAGVDGFLLISSDKAARPVSLMGATKRIAERLVTAAAPAPCASVRFGNVLGSSGSVLQIFRRRLAAGLPLEIRDPRATRYFMTAGEASRLLVLAAGLACPGDLLVLKVGSPLRIESLARRLLTACGREGGEPLVQTSLVAGEKLHEDLAGDLRSEPTTSPWIDRLACVEKDPDALADGIDALRAACAGGDGETVAALLRRLGAG